MASGRGPLFVACGDLVASVLMFERCTSMPFFGLSERIKRMVKLNWPIRLKLSFVPLGGLFSHS